MTVSRRAFLGWLGALVSVQRYLRHLAFGLAGRPDQRGSLRSRFEFSMLPADGGQVIPHTDSPGKVITLVLSMLADGEWEPSVGGGTDVNVPRRSALMFNRMNEKAGFEDVDVVHGREREVAVDVGPKQAVVLGHDQEAIFEFGVRGDPLQVWIRERPVRCEPGLCPWTELDRYRFLGEASRLRVDHQEFHADLRPRMASRLPLVRR